MRRGFTLLEMMVSALIFTFAFVSIYVMFLVGMRHRTESEAATRSALAASSIIADVRLRAGTEPGGPKRPAHYLGDGDAADDAELGGSDGVDPGALSAADLHQLSNRLFGYPDQPGLFYRVIDAQDLHGGRDDERTDALRLSVVVGHLGVDRPSVTVEELRRRFRMDPALDGAAVVEELCDDQVLHRYEAVVHRRAHWAP